MVLIPNDATNIQQCEYQKCSQQAILILKQLVLSTEELQMPSQNVIAVSHDFTC
jgi:hypothetical protein